MGRFHSFPGFSQSLRPGERPNGESSRGEEAKSGFETSKIELVKSGSKVRTGGVGPSGRHVTRSGLGVVAHSGI